MGGRTGVSEATTDQPAAQDAGLWTVPNLISVLRILALPVFLWVLLGLDRPFLAAVLLGLISVTDLLDGMLARRLDQVSEIGKMLDPVADRLVVFAGVVGGMAAGLVPLWLGGSLLVREAIIGPTTIYYLVRRNIRVPVRRMGKTATALIFFAVPFYYLTATSFMPLFWEVVATILGVLGLILYLIVTWRYLGDLRRARG
ncbi:MAG: CDP-alcohol phosphatidyltransferase family protein [Acidimicrobiia bacterium]|nr:CDP-alcohol phosphatidyltransferase family protein [Acidimicrobiia bacterium]MYF83055.1 CDP-alcohol phosphatidyltransferase family protein [Acidimicrobiia bacterium]